MTFLAALLALAAPASAQGFDEPLGFCDLNPDQCNWTLKPDLTIRSISTGCTGHGGEPTVSVLVANDGIVDASAYVDVFYGLPIPPAMGEWGDDFAYISVNAGSTTLRTFVMDASAGERFYVDVLVDTDDEVDESDESNNHDDRLVTVPDCSFG